MTKSPTRYEPDVGFVTGTPEMYVNTAGSYIKFEDYEQLKQRLDAVVAECAAFKSAHPQPFGPLMMQALDAYEKDQDEEPETGMLNAFFILRDSIAVDTPNVTAALAEQQAIGVEKAADYMQTSGAQSFGDCYIALVNYAATLRNGEAV